VDAAAVEPVQEIENTEVVDFKNGQKGKKPERQIDCTNAVQIQGLPFAACRPQIQSVNVKTV
jgi:hypothetical protein